MKKILMLVAAVAMFASCCNNKCKCNCSCSECSCCKDETAAEAVAEETAEEGFEAVFNGETLEGWRGYGMEVPPASWNVDDGAIHLVGSGTGEAQAEGGGDLLYDKKLSNFELRFEYKISKGGNSGVFYLAHFFYIVNSFTLYFRSLQKNCIPFALSFPIKIIKNN